MQSRKVLAALVALMLSFGFGLTPALATAPVPFASGTFFEDEEMFDCGGFTVLRHSVVNFWLKTYFGKDGNPTRLAGQASGVDRLFNSTDPAKHVEGKFTWNYDNNLVTGEETRFGPFYRIVLPGYGPVYVQTGRWHWVDGQWVIEAGLSTLQQDVLCATLK